MIIIIYQYLFVECLDFVCHLKKYNAKNTAGIYFRNTYAGFEGRRYITREDEIFNITTFQNTRVAAGSSSRYKYKVRSKMAVKPDLVYIQQIHETIETTPGGKIMDSGSVFLHFIKPSKHHSWGTLGPIATRYQLFSNITGQFVNLRS